MKIGRPLLLIIMLAAIICFFVFDLGHYLDLGYLQSSHANIDNYYRAHPLQATLIFFTVYIIVTGLSLPGAAIMTLLGGAIFGLLWGTIMVSFASSIGGTLAFLASRFLFRDVLQKRFADNFIKINKGIEEDGVFYLFTLRLVPIFPFFVINLVMGLTPLSATAFYLVSQAGMLPGTMVYVNAGTQLGKIETTGDILSPALLVSFILLGLLPLVSKKLVDFVKSRRTPPARES